MQGRSTRSTVYAPKAAAATSHPLATGEALTTLRAGGNAVDAAVVAAAVLGVVEPHMTGMGGDAFAQVWWAREGSLVALDASGRSGSLATPDALTTAGGGRMPERGPATISVPGAVSGWEALLSRFGTLSLAQALEPAIRLAEGGFPVSPIVADGWSDQVLSLAQDQGARDTFLLDGHRAPRAGEWFANPDLGRSMREIAAEGAGSLYGGRLGSRMVESLKPLGGVLSREDLAGHEASWVEPIGTEFAGHTVWELPPAGQGVAALQMLRLLEPLPLTEMGWNSAQYLHHLIEAKKLAFADLDGHVADQDHMRVSVDALLSDAALAHRRSLIDPSHAAAGPLPGIYSASNDTVYLAVADSQGNMVSFINSIYWRFGSGVVVPGTGFALHNRGGAFVLDEDHPNRVAPGKKPLHTIIPAMLSRSGDPTLAFGVVGRSMQPQGQVQLLLNLLLFHLDLQQAVDAPRFRHLDEKRVALEPGIDGSVRDELTRLGHQIVSDDDVVFGGAQAVMRLERGWSAASDPRRDGCAGGF
jgi:gamma-glutamyltranspeptidase/glutathione hydrolase